MVKKTKPATDSKADNQLAAAVKDSAQQIWLAGLGAFAKAQEEGNKVFEALVKEGKDIQKRTRATAEEKLGAVTGRVGNVAGNLGTVAGSLSKQATDSWDRLETVFEERVARALNRLGVPTNSDVQALIARVDALNASVQSLGGKPARAPRAAAARKAPAKASRAPKAAKATKAAKAAPAAPAAKAPRAPRKAAKKPAAPAAE
ncbi:MAG: poly granule associated protein [Burkholderiales bacterium]|nr:MAG: poly granule associated protein [Burkholderiales bacterium]